MSREDHHSDSEAIGAESGTYSGPLSGSRNKRPGRKIASFNIEDSSSSKQEHYVEITFDASDDSLAFHSLNPANGQEEDPEKALLARGLEKRSGSSSIVRRASARIRQVSLEIKRLASSSRKPQLNRPDRRKSAATHALEGLRFISKTSDGKLSKWTDVEKIFNKITASTNGLLPRSKFGECIGMKESEEFAGVLFDALARKRNVQGNFISKGQLKDFWEQIADPSFDSRLRIFLDMIDKDADGRITEDEVREIITLGAFENKLSNIQKQAGEYARMIMEELDPENHGYIKIENLEMLLLQGPSQSVTEESTTLSRMLGEKLKPTSDDNRTRKWGRGIKYFFLDNWERIWVLALWVSVMAVLFTYKYVQYRRRAAYVVMGHCVCFAKGSAETLKLNMAIILLPVCRKTITWLRNRTKLGVVVPFDDNLNFHKVIAVAITLGVGTHGIAHLACDFPRLLAADEEKWELMQPFFGYQPSSYWHFVKSVVGITGIVMVVLMAIAFTLATPWFRRGKANLPPLIKKLAGFNAFWYSHHLFVIVYALLVVHGYYLYLTQEWYNKTTWMYLAIPVLLYAGERTTRTLRSRIKAVDIQKAAIYPGNVLALHMSKPQRFKYMSGQYMFVNCAAVSPFEWHPFSITSSPGDDHLSVHIRILGDWTKQLTTVFSQVCQPPPNGESGILRAEHFQGNLSTIPNFPKVLIDGPYGAPAQDYKKYDVVLLIGLGIGATPMVSILKDIVNNMRAVDEEAKALENGASPDAQKRKEQFHTRRAYFYWLTREQGSFDWFKGIMNEVAEFDQDHAIELHNYCTSVYEQDDVRSALIAMLQSLHHAKNGVDIVSGTRVKSHFAKPKWGSVFERIALNHPHSRVGVFYCGAPAQIKELKRLASDFSHKTSTKFDFHKENF